MTFLRACPRVAFAALITLALGGSEPQPTPVPVEGSPVLNKPTTPPEFKTAVPAPVFSSDSCKKDEDCAPVPMCHADKCASLEHAGATPSGLMCTMECRGGTVDCGYNHCGCAASASGKKLCALLPGPAKKK